MENSDLRQAAVEAIAAYMHHELFEIGGAQMLPWIKNSAEDLMGGVDGAIEATKNHPMTSKVK